MKSALLMGLLCSTSVFASGLEYAEVSTYDKKEL
jgi:hypothetical protein